MAVALSNTLDFHSSSVPLLSPSSLRAEFFLSSPPRFSDLLSPSPPTRRSPERLYHSRDPSSSLPRVASSPPYNRCQPRSSHSTPPRTTATIACRCLFIALARCFHNTLRACCESPLGIAIGSRLCAIGWLRICTHARAPDDRTSSTAGDRTHEKGIKSSLFGCCVFCCSLHVDNCKRRMFRDGDRRVEMN